MRLTNAIVAVCMATTTLVSDLFDAEVDGVTIEDTNNTSVIVSADGESWVVHVGVGDYTMLYSNNGDVGFLPVFEKNMVDAQDSFVQFMDDPDDVDNFIKTIGTLPGLVDEIDAAMIALEDNRIEIAKQTWFAGVICHWMVTLRWLEETEVIGLDDELVYPPTIVIEKDTNDDVAAVKIVTNALTAISTPQGPLKVDVSNISAEDYIGISLKDEDETLATYYAQSAAKRTHEIMQLLWPVL